MIKILHISQSHGGVKTYIDNIVKNNGGDIYQHYLICSSDYGETDLFHKQFIIKKFYRSPGLSDLNVFSQILSIVKSIKPDLIHCHSSKGGLHGRFIGKLTNIPVIFTPNGLSFLGFKGLKRKLYIAIEKATKLNSFALGVSDTEADRLINEVEYNSKKVDFVQNFVKVPDICTRTYKLRKRVGMIGRITEQKNPLLYLRIAKAVTTEFPDIKFVLLGAGLHDHLMNEVQEFLDEHNLRESVLIEKWASYDNIFDFYDSLDVFLLTSLFEGLSFSLLEAMSIGTPVVVTEVDGNKDLIKNNINGLVSNDQDELVKAIKKLIIDEGYRQQMGKAAYDYVKQFNNSDNAALIYNKYFMLKSGTF